MYQIGELIKQAVSAGIAENAESIRIIFPYNLPSDSGIVRGSGIVAAVSDRIYSIFNGKIIKSEPISSIESFCISKGIGCIFIEYKSGDLEENVLCRADETYTKLFTAAVSDLYDFKKGIIPNRIPIYSTGNSCEKCGRPYPSGSSQCPHCADKKYYIKRLFKIASPWKYMLCLAIAFYFIIAAVNLITPYLNRILVDEYIKAENPILTGFISVIAAMIAVVILNQILSVTRSMILIKTSSGLVKKLRQITFDKIQELSISKISKRTSGELINRVSSDTQTINSFICNDLGDMVQQIITLAAVGLILFIYDYRIALLVLLPIPFILYINKYIKIFLHKIFRLNWNTAAKAESILHDTFSGIRVVKAFGMEKKEIDRYNKAASKERDVSFDVEKFSGSIMPALGFLLGIGEFFLMYYVGNKILSGEMTLGEMVQFSSYVGIIYGPLRWISSFPRVLTRTATAVAKIFEIIDEESEVSDSPDAVDIEITGNIKFNNLCFSYDGITPILKNLNASINAGEMIGIVGRSGVGKSTLINLVMRMYDPTDGSICLDGHNLRDISQASLRSQIGVVLQETFLFSGTIYDNIAYAKPEATPDEIIAASKLSGTHKFVIKLPDAYNTKVGEHGYTLSGGERQRVSIARALLRNPRILILDEATSALDTETEKEVQDALYILTRNRTTLAIAHRLSTLRNADKILVLDKGKIAEFASHDELMKHHGIYFDLVMAQRQMSKIATKK